jgi:serine/threonine-protein kinase RsbT
MHHPVNGIDSVDSAGILRDAFVDAPPRETLARKSVTKGPTPPELRLFGVDSGVDILVPIRSEADVATARQRGRSLAAELNFSSAEAIIVAAVVSELARNIVTHATRGEIRLQVIDGGTVPHGIQVIARDEGPGIRDVDQALREGFSTSGSLGVGLPSVRRLVDDFQVDSAENRGTTITIMKRKRPEADGK